MSTALRILGFATSNRADSINRRLLGEAERALLSAGGDRVDVEILDLRSHPLPIYDGDLQRRDGIPSQAAHIHDRIAAADAVIIANPEYNGGYPALFKNTIDWISRMDMMLFVPRYVGLLSATPGAKAGARGLAHTRDLFANMFVTTHESFGLGNALEVLSPDGWADAGEEARLQQWAAGYLTAATAFREAQLAESSS